MEWEGQEYRIKVSGMFMVLKVHEDVVTLGCTLALGSIEFFTASLQDLTLRW